MSEDAHGGPRRRPCRWTAAGVWFVIALIFLGLAVVITQPLASQISGGLPLGTESVATVPLFNLWTLAWNAESLSRGYAGYWDAPIFHPVRDTFALSEPQPLTGLIAAVLTWATGSSITAYNLILLLALALNGLLAAVLLRGLGCGWLAALTGGSLVELLPFVHQELGVLQLVPLAGVLWLAIAVHRFAAEPGWTSGALLGLALATSWAISVQTAVFFVLAAVPVALWLWWPHLRSPRTWGYLAAGAALFAVLASPMLAAQARASSGEGVERSLETVRKHSAKVGHYLVSPWLQWVPAPGVETAKAPSQRAFWPGTLRVLLAMTAVVVGWRHRAWRHGAIAGALLLMTAWILSVLPHVEVAGLTPVVWLRSLPGLSEIRSFFRFAFVVQLAVAGLAAMAVEFLWRYHWPRPAVARRLLAALALAAAVEMWPSMGEIQELPPADLELPWLSFILESTSPEDVLAFVPFPEGRSSADYLGTAQWMYWQIRHWRPMTNGYSGFFPPEFRELKSAMSSFPSPESLEALGEAGVRFCVVHRAFVTPPAIAELSGGTFDVQPVFRDPSHALDVYEIRSRGAG